MVKRAALILAGGRARRFQSIDKVWQDKALVELAGKSLLVHAIENVQSVVDEVAVCVNDEQRKEKYAQIIQNQGFTNVKIVVDEQINGISGPNVAIISGLKAVQANYCLTLPCDMPFLQPTVAEYLFEQSKGFDVAVPMWPDGRLETLLMLLERRNALEITETLCRLKRPRSDDIPRGASKLLLVSPLSYIKTLDPEHKSFININSRDDLANLRTRRSHGPIVENLKFKTGILPISDLKLLRKAAEMLEEKRYFEAQNMFALCASTFEFEDMYFWAGVSWEKQGDVLINLSKQQSEAKEATQLDFEGKEAFLRAANNYRIESQTFEENHCHLLEERALADKAWCESWAMGKAGHTQRYPSKVR
jgi:molybdopterin-guanine dinucleotide biosynthesis protein A